MQTCSTQSAGRRAICQLQYLLFEISLATKGSRWRWLSVWFGGNVYVLLSYRLDRFLYLLCGKSYPFVRPVFFPFFLCCALLGGRHEIHYRADIGKGLKIFHTALGVVVAPATVAGERFTLTGGNLIGARKPVSDGEIKIGHRVYLGANAVVLGPVIIGDNVDVGAGAVVVSDVASNTVVGGIPAREIKKRPASALVPGTILHSDDNQAKEESLVPVKALNP